MVLFLAMRASMAIQGLEPYASQKKSPPESMMKPLQPNGISVIVTGAGQTTWFATDFRVGRGIWSTIGSRRAVISRQSAVLNRGFAWMKIRQVRGYFFA